MKVSTKWLRLSKQKSNNNNNNIQETIKLDPVLRIYIKVYANLQKRLTKNMFLPVLTLALTQVMFFQLLLPSYVSHWLARWHLSQIASDWPPWNAEICSWIMRPFYHCCAVHGSWLAFITTPRVSAHAALLPQGARVTRTEVPRWSYVTQRICYQRSYLT